MTNERTECVCCGLLHEPGDLRNGKCPRCGGRVEPAFARSCSGPLREVLEAALAEHDEYRRNLSEMHWSNQARALLSGEPSSVPEPKADAVAGTWVSAMHWACSCRAPGNINIGTESVCKDCGTLRPAQGTASSTPLLRTSSE